MRLELILLCVIPIVIMGCSGINSESTRTTSPSVVQPALISKAAVSQFRQFCLDCSYYEFPKVLVEAKQIFVVTGVLEGYPDVLPFFANYTHRISDVLEREGIDEEGLKGVVLFGGGDGILNHDIVVVVVHETGEVIGVYDVMWGR
jgi:hypothetical protein